MEGRSAGTHRAPGNRRSMGLAIVVRCASVLLAMVLLAGAVGERTASPGGRFRGAPAVQGTAVAVVHPSPPVIAPASARSKAPRISAPSAIVEDLDTGRVLFERGADDRRPIASLAKIMTAMLVLGSSGPGDEVRVSRWAAKQPPTNVGLRPGWRMRVDVLLYALMLHSANDVAVALAEHVAGTTGAFDRLMNRQAWALGMANTRFASPSGLRDAGYSTARDVAAMARWAMASPAFAGLVGTRLRTIGLPNGHSLRLENLNDLLFADPSVTGVKTGYTSAAHWSLAVTASRGGHRLVAVVLGAPGHPFADGERLLGYGFQVEAAGAA